MEVPANQWTGFYMTGTSVMKELKGLVQKIYQMLDLLYLKCKPLIVTAVDVAF